MTQYHQRTMSDERREAAHKAFLKYEAKLLRDLKVPEGADWANYLPDNNRANWLFAEWQRLARESRLAENQGAA
ncbi:hypothetical protein [Rhizobium sp. HT1-10]|uniref:hypothetical protein n=1 Tax=Rhizobium sp. HT1-10 TaxID=3111638 RepID=UPI003C1D522E